MTNIADPDHLASSEANWSRSTLFGKAGYIWVQQDKGNAEGTKSISMSFVTYHVIASLA